MSLINSLSNLIRLHSTFWSVIIGFFRGSIEIWSLDMFQWSNKFFIQVNTTIRQHRPPVWTAPPVNTVTPMRMVMWRESWPLWAVLQGTTAPWPPATTWPTPVPQEPTVLSQTSMLLVSAESLKYHLQWILYQVKTVLLSSAKYFPEHEMYTVTCSFWMKHNLFHFSFVQFLWPR